MLLNFFKSLSEINLNNEAKKSYKSGQELTTHFKNQRNLLPRIAGEDQRIKEQSKNL